MVIKWGEIGRLSRVELIEKELSGQPRVLGNLRRLDLGLRLESIYYQ